MVVFLRVQRYMYEQFDIMHLHDWVHNQNQYRRKRKAVRTQKTQQKKLKHWSNDCFTARTAAVIAASSSVAGNAALSNIEGGILTTDTNAYVT